jgi:hypothetical protein
MKSERDAINPCKAGEKKIHSLLNSGNALFLHLFYEEQQRAISRYKPD